MEQRPRARRGEGRNPSTLQNGFAIREFRELRRWEGTFVAAEVGISANTLYNLEAERRSTTDDVIRRIAAVLQVNVEAIRRERSDLAARRPDSLAEAVA